MLPTTFAKLSRASAIAREPQPSPLHTEKLVKLASAIEGYLQVMCFCRGTAGGCMCRQSGRHKVQQQFLQRCGRNVCSSVLKVALNEGG